MMEPLLKMPRIPTHMNLKTTTILSLWGALAFLFLHHQITTTLSRSAQSNRNASEAKKHFQHQRTLIKNVKPYSKSGVYKTQQLFASGCANLLMIFDSETGKFHSYHDPRLLNKSRPDQVFFVMAQALYTFLPERFQVGSPPLQILFSTDDYPTVDLRKIDLTTAVQEQQEGAGVTTEENNADESAYAPVLQFGSTPRDPHLLDPVQIIEMPFAKIMPCLGRLVFDKLGLGRCIFDEGIIPALIDGTKKNVPTWNELKPQIIWRGADYQFLERFKSGMAFGNRLVHDFDAAATPQDIVQFLFQNWERLYPRWKAVTLSLQASLDAANNENAMPWIDVKFFEKAHNTRHDEFMNAGLMISTDDFMTYDEQMMYKYHIDFGGAGGTTWTGTFSKLAMPGVLFHHETQMRDFYFDVIKPWVHYIPVKEDLSDLREKYEWAEANPDRAKAISEAASDLIQTIDSGEWFAEMYIHFFKEQLGNVVDAYIPSGDESLQSLVSDYWHEGIEMVHFSHCDQNTCFKNSELYGLDMKQGENIEFKICDRGGIYYRGRNC